MKNSHRARLPLLAAALLALVAGCSRQAPAPAPTEAPAPAHAHHHHAPHGGALIELGEEFAHVELLFDPSSGAITAYVLDGEAERPVRIAQPELRLLVQLAGKQVAVTLSAVENVLTGEKAGDTSEFRGTAPELKGTRQFDGTLQAITVRGADFEQIPFAYPGSHSHR